MNLRNLGKVLLLLALPCILRLGYEAIILRWLSGPQNLFFSLAHGQPHPVAAAAFALSALAAMLLFVYSIVVALFAVFGKLRRWGPLRFQMATLFVPLLLLAWLAAWMQESMSRLALSAGTAGLALVIAYFIYLCVRVWRPGRMSSGEIRLPEA